MCRCVAAAAAAAVSLLEGKNTKFLLYIFYMIGYLSYELNRYDIIIFCILRHLRYHKLGTSGVLEVSYSYVQQQQSIEYPCTHG